MISLPWGSGFCSWTVDSKGKSALDADDYFEAVFELADIWCQVSRPVPSSLTHSHTHMRRSLSAPRNPFLDVVGVGWLCRKRSASETDV